MDVAVTELRAHLGRWIDEARNGNARQRAASLNVAIVYFDSSALVKLVLDETGSDLAAQLWNACDAALSSRLAYPEVCAALAAAGRNRSLTESEASAAADEWETFWASIRPIEVSAGVRAGIGGGRSSVNR